VILPATARGGSRREQNSARLSRLVIEYLQSGKDADCDRSTTHCWGQRRPLGTFGCMFASGPVAVDGTR